MDTVEVVGFGVGNETPIHNITNGTETWEIAVFGTTGALAWVSVMVSAALIYGHLRYWCVLIKSNTLCNCVASCD